jgi:hypothetical protein
MTEPWAIAIAGFVVTIVITLFGLGIKALWSIARTFRELVTKAECANEMGKHCKDIAALRKGFEENKSAIRQICLAFKQLHNVDIDYGG